MVNLSGPSREPWIYGKVLGHVKHLKATAKTTVKAMDVVSTSGPRKAPGDSPGVMTTATASPSRPRSTPCPRPTSEACSMGSRATPKTLATVNALRRRRTPAHRGEAPGPGAGLVSSRQRPWPSRAPAAHGAVPTKRPALRASRGRAEDLRTAPDGVGEGRKINPEKKKTTQQPSPTNTSGTPLRTRAPTPSPWVPPGVPSSPSHPLQRPHPGGWGW